jgi:hypothetical protein
MVANMVFPVAGGIFQVEKGFLFMSNYMEIADFLP